LHPKGAGGKKITGEGANEKRLGRQGVGLVKKLTKKQYHTMELTFSVPLGERHQQRGGE